MCHPCHIIRAWTVYRPRSETTPCASPGWCRTNATLARSCEVARAATFAAHPFWRRESATR
eukprot:6626783-Pyramimonas_sp.AAC.1